MEFKSGSVEEYFYLCYLTDLMSEEIASCKMFDVEDDDIEKQMLNFINSTKERYDKYSPIIRILHLGEADG